MELNEVCRTCLQQSKTMQSIFNVIKVPNLEHTFPIIELLKIFADISVSPNDGLPDNFCSNCLDNLYQSYTFKLTCEKSQAFLIQLKDDKSCANEMKSSLNEFEHYAQQVKQEPEIEIYMEGDFAEPDADEQQILKDQMKSRTRPADENFKSVDSRKKSDVWYHFITSFQSKRAKCRYCCNILSFSGGNTSNLGRHLKRKHPTISVSRTPPIFTSSADLEANKLLEGTELPVSNLAPTTSVSVPSNVLSSDIHQISPPSASFINSPSAPKNISAQTSMSSFVEVIRPVPITKSRLIDFQLLRMISKKFHPFSLVKEPDFVKFAHMLNPGYKLPSCKTISNSLLTSLYEETKASMKNKLDMSAAVCLTTDEWTSVNNTSYLAVIAHYLSDNGKELEFRSYLLNCSHLQEKHTAQNISDWLLSTAREWGIENKITAIATHNAANMSAAVRLCKWQHISCFAHTLNLIVQRGLADIATVVCKVKSVVQHFKQSNHAAAKLSEMQTQMNLPVLKLKQDTITRWNSTFEMLSRFFNNKECLVATMAILELEDTFSNNDWNIIEKSIEILQIFEFVTQEISAEKSVTLSKLPLLYTIIVRKLNSVLNLPSEVNRMRSTLLTDMTSRLDDLETRPLIAQATLLDPRFKKKGFANPDNFLTASKALKEKLSSLSSSTVPSTSRNHDSFLWKEFDASCNKLVSSSTVSSVVEIDKFLAEPLLARQKDPLHWWYERKVVYPMVYDMALKTLCISATCERIFSKVGYLFSEKRTRLTSPKLFKLVFLNKNL